MSNSPTDGTHVWLIVWKAYDVLRTHAMKSIESLDMCVTDFGVLELLLHKGAAPINVFGEKLSLASGSITAAIDRLERRNLVRRIPSATDRRAKLVDLTEEGRQLIETAFEAHRNHMSYAVEGLTESESSQLLALLKKLGKSAQQRLQDSPTESKE
ncbi:MAG: MarR family transcriptional regulator [Candidatus Obscuribacterales bacterium]|nr:MarR family transcriptional regulator [Candidatus Obscuribacterales bacterium]